MRRLRSALCPTTALPIAPPSTQSLFARSWRYLDQGDVYRLLRGHYSPRSLLLQTHASIPLALLSFGLSLVRGVSAGCYQPLLRVGPSRRYLCESFPECLGPCHGGPVECICLFLPPRHRPSPVHYRGRLPAFPRQNDFMTDRLFETAAISLCSGPPVCSPPRSFPPQRLIASGQPGL